LSTHRDQSKINLLAAILAIVLVVWGVLEFALHTLRPDAIEREYRISGQFAATNKAIWERHAELQISALDLAMRLAEITSQGLDNLSAFEAQINNNPPTIQTAVFHNGALVIWTDGMSPSLLEAYTENKSAIYTDNTGFFLLASSNIASATGNWQVFRSRRIFELQNSNPLYGDIYSPEDPIIRKTAPSLFYLVGSPHMLPVGYRFNIMTVLDEQTTGFFVVSVNDPVIRRYLHPQLDRFMRTVVLSLIVILLWQIIRIWFSADQFHYRTASYLLLIWSSYGISWYLGIPQFLRMLGGTDGIVHHLGMGPDIIQLVLSTLFLLLSVVLISNALIKQQRYYAIDWIPRKVAVSLVLGITGGLSFGWLLSRLESIAQLFQSGFLTPSITSASETVLLYAIIGLSVFAVIALNLSLSWFFSNSEKKDTLTIASISSVSLIFSYYITVYIGQAGIGADYVLISVWIGLWALVTIFAGIMLPGNYEIFRFAGPVRTLVVSSVIITLLCLPSFVSNTNKSIDESLHYLASGSTKGSQFQIDALKQINGPYIVLNFDQNEVTVSGDFISGQFPEQLFLPESIRDQLQAASFVLSSHSGPYFRYREIAMRLSDHHYTIVRTRLPNAGNFVYATVRFLLINILILAIVALVIHYSGLQVYKGYEKHLYYNQIYEKNLIFGLFLLTALLITTHITLKQKNLNSIEMELLEQLELLQFAPEQDLLSGTLFVGIDYEVYTAGTIVPQRNLGSVGYSGFDSLLPYTVYRYIREEGGTRVTRWKKTPDGDRRLTGFRAIRSESDSGYSIVSISNDTHAGRYTDRLLQDMSFWSGIFLVVVIVIGYAGVRLPQNLLQPLELLSRDMKRSADGRLNTLVNIQASNEIAEIAGIYNSMIFKIKDLQDEVADSERKAVWAEIARQVAHEIKNPLTPMKLNIQHLYQQFEYGNKSVEDLRPAVRRITDTIIREIDSLSNIASDFSRFARPMSESLLRKDLNTVLREVTDLYTHDKRIQIRFDPSAEPIFVELAADELKRVAVNLIKNATEAIGNSGIIAVRTYSTTQNAYFEVVDNGAGIKQEDQNAIFKPNFSTKDGGTGLGLAMSKKIVLAHNGNLRFASVESIGSTFTVQLPRSAEVTDLNTST